MYGEQVCKKHLLFLRTGVRLPTLQAKPTSRECRETGGEIVNEPTLGSRAPANK